MGPASVMVSLLLMQVQKMFIKFTEQSMKETLCRFHSVKYILQVPILFYLLSAMGSENLMKKIVGNYNLFVETFWEVQTLQQEFQSFYFRQNFSESHRIQKVAMLIFRKFILKSVNWSSLIIRYQKQRSLHNRSQIWKKCKGRIKVSDLYFQCNAGFHQIGLHNGISPDSFKSD